MKTEMERRLDRSSYRRERPSSDTNDIVVKVICKYRAELFFKISRKTKLSRLFNAWTDRMELVGGTKADREDTRGERADSGERGERGDRGDKLAAANLASLGASKSVGLEFIFTHLGRTVEADQTPEELGIDDGDEILAVELMDLTTDAVSIVITFIIIIGDRCARCFGAR